MSEGSSSFTEILDLLRKHGERLDSEIAEEMRIPLDTVRQQLSRLPATGLVVTCNLIRYKDGGACGRMAMADIGLHPLCSARTKA